MNIYLLFILTIIIGEYLLTIFVESLNVRSASPQLPEEFSGFYDAGKYQRSQEYLKTNTHFSLIKSTFFTMVTVIFILAGGFNVLDVLARAVSSNQIIAGLVFAGLLFSGSLILSTPFSAYHTFVIEERFGFNKTTVKTFIADMVKTVILGVCIGGAVLAVIIWFFIQAGGWAWFWCWVAVTVFQLFLLFIAPVLIMPLFNKFIPLEDGELKETLTQYAQAQKFSLAGIFKMDASRRSSKSNAFFTGFGKFRRIALFDTLIERHTTDELVSVLAHEIGHYKQGHFTKGVLMSIATSGLMFYMLSFFINNRDLFAAFRMQEVSIYASLVFFGFLYQPLNFLVGVVESIVSRKHEYAADRFAVATYHKPDEFIIALKKLSVDNLSNLTPHPLKVFLSYSHPPVLKRIRAIRHLGIAQSVR